MTKINNNSYQKPLQIVRILFVLAVAITASAQLRADEGMWMVNTFHSSIYPVMKKMGLKLKPNQIYNLKDLPGDIISGNTPAGAISNAIVAMDGGMCSGSIISKNGLLITNYHCAYADIHDLSTPENNYIERGFWAFTMDAEKPVKGKTVTFLRGIADVTERVNVIIDSISSSGHKPLFLLKGVQEILAKQYKSRYQVSLESFWDDKKYFLFFYEEYADVRLVAAPPACIGAFGGETDNWGWPQQKGDFAMYRVYSAPDGKPADYSKDNIPLFANDYLTISSKGYKEGDFTFILGYPGTTNRAVGSSELKEMSEVTYPIMSYVKRCKLDVLKRYMDADSTVRLKYQDEYLNISNFADYLKWGVVCINKHEVVSKIEQREREMQNWINDSPERVAKYGTLLQNIEAAYNARKAIVQARSYMTETLIRGSDVLLLAQRFVGLTRSAALREGGSLDTCSVEVKNLLYKHADQLFSNISLSSDKDVFKKMLQIYVENVPERFWNEGFKAKLGSYNGDTDKYVDYIFDNSAVIGMEKLKNFFSSPRSAKDIEQDPITDVVFCTMVGPYSKVEKRLDDSLKFTVNKLIKQYHSALYEMNISNNAITYPDANSTMRLTYGKVGCLIPSDAVKYDYFSTVKGILEKYDPENYDFKLRDDYLSLLKGQKPNFHVNFITDTDITGGNSGSSVLNARGEIIGLAFDGNRDSMAGDLYYSKKFCKTVCVDIRYVLWVTGEYGGAKNLIDEMTIN